MTHFSRLPQRTLPRSRARQRGAVLYVALMMLILLALLGIVGMQVTGMQERMSSNYRAVNLAFQNAEDSAREAECFVESEANRTTATCAAVTISQVCDDGFDASNWAAAATGDSSYVRSIGNCISGQASLGKGVKPISEDANPIYQITSYSGDTAANSSASAAIDTIFRP